MTENKGIRVPMQLSGSVTVTSTENQDGLGRVKTYQDERTLVQLVMGLAKVSQAQAEHLVVSGTWEGYMHQMRTEAFRYFQAKEHDQ